jgi:hypothetical protein
MLEVMMMRITRQVTKWLEKWKMELDQQPLIPEHHSSSPKIKPIQELSISIEAKMAEEVVDDVGL